MLHPGSEEGHAQWCNRLRPGIVMSTGRGVKEQEGNIVSAACNQHVNDADPANCCGRDHREGGLRRRRGAVVLLWVVTHACMCCDAEDACYQERGQCTQGSRPACMLLGQRTWSILGVLHASSEGGDALVRSRLGRGHATEAVTTSGMRMSCTGVASGAGDPYMGGCVVGSDDGLRCACVAGQRPKVMHRGC